NYTIGDGADTMNGGADADILTVTGTGNGDVLDLIFDGTRIVSVEGGAIANIESLIANLGNGSDTISFAGSAAGVSANLLGTISGVSAFSSVDNLTGGNGGDTLTGNNAANELNGGAGNDTLNGGAGADDMIGGAGNDTYFIDNVNDDVTEAANG